MATIIKYLDGGSEYVNVASGDDIKIYGSVEGDTVYIAPGTGTATVLGGEGADTIQGRQGEGMAAWATSSGSWLYGEGGNDSINASILFTDKIYIDGGSGNDTVYYANNYYAPMTLVGGEGDDVFQIKWEDTSSYGIYPVTVVESDEPKGGHDRIELELETGADFWMDDGVEDLTVTAIWWDNLGDDTYDHTNGVVDTVAGSGTGAYIKGNDLANRIILSDRDDRAYGWTGADTIEGGVGKDELYGEDGYDVLLGGSHNDTLDGGYGVDLLYGGSEADSVVGGFGDDYLYGQQGRDTLQGGDGNDKLYGGTENDALGGGAGNDQLEGGAGADTMTGGTGSDAYFVDDAGDRVVEAAYGGDDYVQTSLLSYSLAAQVENLIVTGGYGPATTRYATGNDLGNSFQMKDGVYSLMHDSVSGGAGSDHMILGQGNDTGFGGTENDTMYGEDGNDLLRGDEGADALYGGNGNDTVEGGFGADNVQGGAGNDQVSGGDGNDIVRGGTGRDTVSGGAGADTVYGDEGSDMVYGSDGADRLYGGAGVDWFNYTLVSNSTAAARDWVMDFVKGTDKINLNMMDADATTAGNQNFYFAGPGMLAVDPGNVWMTELLTGTMIRGDVTGDFAADFEIFVYGAYGMTAADVIL
jgi:Ca2+-binding RTX toxin-like protein